MDNHHNRESVAQGSGAVSWEAGWERSHTAASRPSRAQSSRLRTARKQALKEGASERDREREAREDREKCEKESDGEERDREGERGREREREEERQRKRGESEQERRRKAPTTTGLRARWILSSIVFFTMKRCTVVGRVCPMRCTLDTHCASTAALISGSTKKTWLASTRFRPEAAAVMHKRTKEQL